MDDVGGQIQIAAVVEDVRQHRRPLVQRQGHVRAHEQPIRPARRAVHG